MLFGEAGAPIIVVMPQDPNPYYDNSYAVNSANVGPYGDAIMQELIPYCWRTAPDDPAAGGRDYKSDDGLSGAVVSEVSFLSDRYAPPPGSEAA